MSHSDPNSKLSKNLLGLSKKACILAIGISITASISGCSLLPKEQDVQAPVLVSPAKIDYDLVEVEKGSIIKSLTGMGAFVSVTQQDAYLTYGKGGNITAIYVKAGDYVKKGQVLAEVDSGNLGNQIKEQELVLKKAQINYDKLKASNADSYDLEDAQVDLQLASLQLQDLKEQLAKTEICAGISGMVAFATSIKIGDFIEPYKPVFSIVNPSDLQVEYTGPNAGDFKVGMKVKLDYNSKTYTGRVVMAPSSTPADADIQDANKVVIAMGQIPNIAKIGDEVNISVELLKKDNVLIVPRNSVLQYQDKYYVEVLENGIKDEKFVQVGIQNDTEIEIVAGLSEGEKIIKK